MANQAATGRAGFRLGRSNWALGVVVAALTGFGPALAFAGGETVTVNTTDDVSDFGGSRQVGDLPGPDGKVSFREACTAANNTAGPQTIAFAIPPAPEAEWWDGVAMLFMDYSVFPLTDDETTVDFTTQTDFTGDTNPDGNEVGIRCAPLTGAPAIYVAGDRCVVKGLDLTLYVGHAIQLEGHDNRVISCTISGPLYSAVYVNGVYDGPPATGNIVGGTQPGEGNRLSAGNHGVRIDTPAEANVVIGNYLTGVYAGVAVRGNRYTGSPVGNRIGGPTPEERNVISDAGRYGEEGFPDGSQVMIEMAIDTVVEGNYIGTTADGMASAGQIGPNGVEVRDSTGTIVRNNLISGLRVMGTNHYAGQLFGTAVLVNGVNADTTDTRIAGNLIGTDATGQNPIVNLNGVGVSYFLATNPPRDVQIENNTIAFSERRGVYVGYAVRGVHLTGNSIFDNGGVGIDLARSSGYDGVTQNDPGDGDVGANGLQNFPVIGGASAQGGGTRVQGTFNSRPNAAFTLEFFGNTECDPTGFGEGETTLGTLTVMTDGGGDAAFDELLPGIAEAGMVVTATATDSAGNTSEFSECVVVEAGFVAGDLNCDGTLDGADIDPFFLALGDPSGYAQQFPNCDSLFGDMNSDGALDGADIDPFFACLANGNCP